MRTYAEINERPLFIKLTVSLLLLVVVILTYIQTPAHSLGQRALRVGIGILLGDFIASFLHFIEDNYLRYRPGQPTVLNDIALDNELHHHFPRLMTGSSYLDVIFESAAVALLAVAALWVIVPDFLRDNGDIVAVAIAFATQGNAVHRWQHMRDCQRPAAVSLLMRIGVLQSREMHRSHHVGVPDGRYSPLLSFTNPVYDTLRVWDVLRALLRVVGLQPCMVSSELWVRDEAVCPKPIDLDDAEVRGVARKMREQLRAFREENACAYYGNNATDFVDARCESNPMQFCFGRDVDRFRLY